MTETDGRKATPEELRALDDAQFNEFGAVVAGSGLNATHLANGLVQTLLALPQVCERPPDWAPSERESLRERYQGAVRGAVAALGFSSQPLSEAARSICVTHTKEGPTSLARGAAHPDKYSPMVLAGQEHVQRHFVDQEGGFALTEEQHELFSRALNADRKVMGRGGHAPTTPGAALFGHDSNYTLYTMIPATFLGMLARSSSGRECLGALHELAWDKRDTQSQLVGWLGLDRHLTQPPPPSPEQVTAALPYPSTDAPGWEELSGLVGEMTQRLLSWRSQTAGKLDLLMSLIDLIGLIFLLRGLGPRQPLSRALLLVGVEAPREVDRVAVKLAKDAMRGAGLRLEKLAGARRADPEGQLVLGPEYKSPGTRKAPLTGYFRRIAQSTRWLYPTGGRAGKSRGQAQHFLCPGVRQLSTLTRSLVGKEEVLPWPRFHARALRLGIVLGGAQEHDADRVLGIPGARAGLRLAGQANQRVLIDLGLAYRESDNVVLVTGGS